MNMDTQFAPPERESDEVILESAKQFEKNDFMLYMLNAVPDPFVVVNDKRQVVFTNDAFLQMVGAYSKAHVLGQRPGEIMQCTHAEDQIGGCGTSEACRGCGAVQAVLAGLKGKENAKEARITLVGGDSLDLKIFARPLEMNGDTYCIFTVRDISNEKRRRALERVFFHDILNTAGVVSSYAQLLEVDKEHVDDLADQIYGTSQRLIEEIRSQKDLTAAENDDLEVKPQDIIPNDILEEAISLYKGYAEINQVKLVLQPSQSSTVIQSDHVILRRVICNMLKNAIEASHIGQTVSMGFDVGGGYISFWVKNPAYIPRHNQLQIFQRSFSTKGQGRGLGTYSMKLLSQRYLSGDVAFNSDKLDGTTFRATYPLAWRGESSAAD